MNFSIFIFGWKRLLHSPAPSSKMNIWIKQKIHLKLHAHIFPLARHFFSRWNQMVSLFYSFCHCCLPNMGKWYCLIYFFLCSVKELFAFFYPREEEKTTKNGIFACEPVLTHFRVGSRMFMFNWTVTATELTWFHCSPENDLITIYFRNKQLQRSF
mgnify:CR=1 FL=1